MIKKAIILLTSLFFINSCSSISYPFIIPTSKSVINLVNKVYTDDKGKLLEIGGKLLNFEPEWKGTFRIKYEQFYENGAKLERIKNEDFKNDSVIYMVHGGAYIVPLNSLYRELAKYMAEVNGNYDIVIVDYRQLPYNTYPDGNNDVYNGFEWVKKNYKHVYVMGDSAGGNLAVSTMLKRRDEGKPLADGLVLLSPFLDISYKVDSRKRNQAKDILLGGDSPDFIPAKLITKNDYYRDSANLEDPYISPIYGKFNGFPSTYIEVDKNELLYDDSIILANKLKKENVYVELIEREGLFHVYQIIPNTTERADSIKKIFSFLDKLNGK